VNQRREKHFLNKKSYIYKNWMMNSIKRKSNMIPHLWVLRVSFQSSLRNWVHHMSKHWVRFVHRTFNLMKNYKKLLINWCNWKLNMRTIIKYNLIRRKLKLILSRSWCKHNKHFKINWIQKYKRINFCKMNYCKVNCRLNQMKWLNRANN
jgi:hypothetical protein